MADIFPLQQDVNRKAALHGPQVAKCRKRVSIIWRAGRPSVWALPRILVSYILFYVLSYHHKVMLLVLLNDQSNKQFDS